MFFFIKLAINGRKRGGRGVMEKIDETFLARIL